MDIIDQPPIPASYNVILYKSDFESKWVAGYLDFVPDSSIMHWIKKNNGKWMVLGTGSDERAAFMFSSSIIRDLFVEFLNKRFKLG